MPEQIRLETVMSQRDHTPLITMKDVFDAQDRDYKLKKQREKDQEEEDIRIAFQTHQRPDGTPDYDKIVNTVSMKYPDRGLALKDTIAKGRAADLKAKSDELTFKTDQYDRGIQLAHGIYDQASLDKMLPQISKLDPDVAAFIGTTWDPVESPKRVQAAIQTSMEAKAALDERRRVVTQFNEGKGLKQAAGYLRTARTDEEYQEMIGDLRHAGVEEAFIQMLPKKWEPADPKVPGSGTKAQLDGMGLDATQEAALDTQRAHAEYYRGMAERATNPTTPTGGLTPARIEATRVGAASRLSARLLALEEDRKGDMDPIQGVRIPMTDEEYERRHAIIMEMYAKELGPATPPGGIPAPAVEPDSPAYPKGVQRYLQGTLAAKYSNYNDAKAELDRAWPKLMREHPQMDRATVENSLKGMFPAGAAPAAAPAAGAPAAPTVVPAGAPASGSQFGGTGHGANLAPTPAATPTATPAAKGLAAPGTVDMYGLPPTGKNAEGATEPTEFAIITVDGKEVVVPTVTADGRLIHPSDEALTAEYKKSGRHLGVFDNFENADKFVAQLEKDFEAGKYKTRPAAPAAAPPSKPAAGSVLPNVPAGKTRNIMVPGSQGATPGVSSQSYMQQRPGASAAQGAATRAASAEAAANTPKFSPWSVELRTAILERFKAAKFDNGRPMYPSVTSIDDPKIAVWIAANKQDLIKAGLIKKQE